MPDTAQLPALLRLIDDTSETVRTTVLQELSGFGDELEAALRALPSPPDDETIAEVLATVARHREGPTRTADAGGHDDASETLFTEGQLVRHKRYGYRGVVVAVDTSCRAPDEWYENNRTQPDRDQPWYHVLVHDGDHVTYAAQTSLLPDESMDEIRHPYAEHFFDGFDEGRYRRNARPWPGFKP
jgi:heat shock protein HspQ